MNCRINELPENHQVTIVYLINHLASHNHAYQQHAMNRLERISRENPYYGHSYYIDTIINSNNKGLCLNGSRWDYESISEETYERVKNFLRKFVLTNQLNIEHSKMKYIDESYIYSYGGKWIKNG